MDSYVQVLAHNTAGGLLIAWDSRFFTKIDHTAGAYCLTVDLAFNLDTSVTRITGVYGPSTYAQKQYFFREISDSKPTMQLPWILAGDFNVTLNPADRSNANYPPQQMMQFRELISSLSLIDMRLQGRQYTWSTAHTHVRLDRFLVNAEWMELFPNTTQRAISAAVSDHCPILCMCQTKFPTANVFRVENTWLKESQFR